MRRQYVQGIILSLAIIFCIVLAAGACLASTGGLPVPPLPPATLPQTTGQSSIDTPAASPIAAPQDQQASTGCNTVSMDQFYAPPPVTPAPQSVNESQDDLNTNATLPELSQQEGKQSGTFESHITAANNTTAIGQSSNSEPSINRLARNLIGKLLTFLMG